MTSLNYLYHFNHSRSFSRGGAGHDCSTEKELMANLLNGVFKLV
jgi:hypothetical protein